ncbi:MAG: hypothetical protein JNJ54_01635 [Myxococcaceae bacterium]|nr:hypothetical protein [Myxococcaceae bacterium]
MSIWKAAVAGLLFGVVLSCGTMGPPTTCTIAGSSYNGGATNPDPDRGVCQVCTPGLTVSAWTNARVGTSCGDSKVCISGGRCARAFRMLSGTGMSTWYDVGGTASEVWVVGAASQALRSVDQGATWTAVPLPGLQNRYGVWSPAPGQAFVVGGGGSVLSTQNGGGDWTRHPLPMGRVVKGVWGASASEVFVVGADEFIAKTTSGGQSWQVLRSNFDGGAQLTLNAVWGDASSLYVVGEGGTILRSTDRATFSRVRLSTTVELVSVWGTGLSIWAVGPAGTLLRTKDGSTWAPVTAPTRADLSDIWGVGADVFLATASGQAFLSSDDGATWREVSTAGAPALSAVWGASADGVYAVGSSGTVLRTP